VILPMARVRLVGPPEALDRALRFLQAQGALEIRAPPANGPVRQAAASAVLAEEEARLASQRSRAEALAARLAPDGPPAGASPPAPAVAPPVGGAELDGWLDGLEREEAALAARRAALVEEREAAERFARLVVALAPLEHRVAPALEPELHGLVLRDEGGAVALLEAEVRRIAGADGQVVSRALDGGQVGVLLVVPRVHGRAVSALLFERGVEELPLPTSCAGRSVVDVLLRVAGRTRRIPGELEAIDARRSVLAASAGPALARVAREAQAALERDRTAERCGRTRFAFVVSGYMPAERVDGLRAAAARALGAGVVVLASPPPREAWGEVPVVLRNPAPIRPFERLLAFVPLPRYGSIDPTPWLAVSFPLFFGLVLGDVAFGALGLGVALVARARGWGGALGRDLAAVAMACSLAAALFGVLFGEAFGALGEHLGLHPLWMDRREAVLGLLAVAVGVGAVHVLLGTALGVVGAIRRGHRREAVARAARLVLLPALAAGGAALAGVLPRAVATPAFTLAALALATAIGAEGPLAVLDVVLGLGNVLSYARLMALGLASVLLAEVANLLAGALQPVAAGVALAVLLHAVNFSLGLVSPVIASLRLHYVEFFEKFYDEGGEPFRPFARAA
jgi:V/A-type H+-transporting ATPase subunit I